MRRRSWRRRKKIRFKLSLLESWREKERERSNNVAYSVNKARKGMVLLRPKLANETIGLQ